MSQPQNRLITRGMGAPRAVHGRASLVTHGGGGFFRRIIQAATDVTRRAIRLGQSGTKRALRELEEIIIGAKLLRVNGEKPEAQIQGHITVKVNLASRISVMAEGVSKRARTAWEDVKISIKRVK